MSADVHATQPSRNLNADDLQEVVWQACRAGPGKSHQLGSCPQDANSEQIRAVPVCPSALLSGGSLLSAKV